MRRHRIEQDLPGALAWITEPSSLSMLGRRSVAFYLALKGPEHFGCSKINEVAEQKGIPPSTLRALRTELRRVYGIFPIPEEISACHQHESRMDTDMDEDDMENF